MEGYHAGRLRAAATLAPSLFGEETFTPPPGAVRLHPTAPTGAERKAAGMETVASHVPDEYAARFTAAVRAFPAGREFTADDVTGAVGFPPGNPNGVGALMSGLARAGFMTKVGYRPSTRESRNAGDIKVWRRSTKV